MVLPAPLGWRPVVEQRPRRRRGLWWWLGPVLAVLGVASVVAIQVELPYYAIAPGDARQINTLITVEGAEVFPPEGEVDFATVSLDRVNVYEAVFGWLDRDVDVFPAQAILGDTDPSDLTRVNIQAMADSKQVAALVALRKLGYTVDIRGEGAVVLGVVDGLPATRALQAGDVITAVGDTPIRTDTDLVAAIQAREPGESVLLHIQGADGSTRTEEVVLAARDDGSAILGVTPGTHKLQIDFPFDVNIDSGQVGGPSAGLAFTLAILDVLTAGELTGGHRVAATGTIRPDGTVGAVGGVPQKVAAVKARGVELFLVPQDEYEQARRRAGSGLRVVPVGTLDDALAALATLDGSNALALGSPGSAASATR